MAMRVEITGHCGAVNFVAAYAPTESGTSQVKGAVGKILTVSSGGFHQRKESVYVMIDANARTAGRVGDEDDKIVGN